MRPEAIGALAQQLGLTPEQAQMLMSGDIDGLLSAGAPLAPQMRSMLTAMQAMNSADEADPTPRGRSRQRGVNLERLRRRTMQLEQELVAADELVGHLASVLGACHCFGFDPECSSCQGHGGPGSRATSDAEQFLSWVGPVLQRMGLQVVVSSEIEARLARHANLPSMPLNRNQSAQDTEDN